MRTRTYVLRSFLFVLTLTAFNAWAQQPDVPERIAEAKRCIQPWLEGVREVVQRSQHKQAREYELMIKDGLYAEPYAKNSKQIAINLLLPGKQTQADMQKLRLVPLCQNSNIRKMLKEKNSAAMFDIQLGALLLESDSTSPKIVLGLIILHELRHWWQFQAGKIPATNKRDFLMSEVDAYEFEFQVLDSLKLPGYTDVLAAEFRRLRTPNAGISMSPTNPGLDRMFPGLGMHLAPRKRVALIISLRALFKTFDQDFRGQEVLQQKMNLLETLGYK